MIQKSKDMSELKYKGDWEELKKKLKDRYAILTESDLDYEEGEEEKLLNHLEEKLGKSKKELKDTLREL